MSEINKETVRQLFDLLTPENMERIDEEIKTRVCSHLTEKYRTAFQAAAVGNRLNRDAATVFVHPKAAPEQLFTAWVKTDGTVVDDYASNRLLYGLEQKLEGALTAIGIRGKANCVPPRRITDESDLALTLPEWIEKHGVDRILCRVILQEESAGAMEALAQVSREVPCVLTVHAYVLEGQAFEGCAGCFAAYPSVSDAMIREYQPSHTLFASMENGETAAAGAASGGMGRE